MKGSVNLIAMCAVLLMAAPPARPQAEVEPHLAVALYSAELLAEAAVITEAARIECRRLEGATLHERTGLVWTRADNGVDVDWYEAAQYCEDLEIGAWRDWRLPTIEELEALHERRSSALYKLPAAFRPTGCCPWSSSPSSEGAAWNFSFHHRQRFSGVRDYSYELRALCVRAPSAEDVAFYELAAEKARKKRKLAAAEPVCDIILSTAPRGGVGAPAALPEEIDDRFEPPSGIVRPNSPGLPSAPLGAGVGRFWGGLHLPYSRALAGALALAAALGAAALALLKIRLGVPARAVVRYLGRRHDSTDNLTPLLRHAETLSVLHKLSSGDAGTSTAGLVYAVDGRLELHPWTPLAEPPTAGRARPLGLTYDRADRMRFYAAHSPRGRYLAVYEVHGPGRAGATPVEPLPAGGRRLIITREPGGRIAVDDLRPGRRRAYLLTPVPNPAGLPLYSTTAQSY